MKVFLIPGLGYDQRIFERLNFKNQEVEYINWIKPEGEESIKNYAKRMAAKIDEQLKNQEEGEEGKEEIVLIGHSFGGIISQEIAAQRKIDKIILLSSMKSRNEIPFLFRLIKPLKIYKLFTKKLCIKSVKYWGRFHDFKNKEDIELFKSMIQKNSDEYLQWALKTLSGWHEPKLPQQTKLIHLHGTKDRTLGFRSIKKPVFAIENGSHIMCYTMPELISKIISNKLQ